MMQKEHVFTREQLPDIVQMVKKDLSGVRIIALQGDLGSGKTTFVAELLKQFGVVGIVHSPTFSYVQKYETSQGKSVFHFDLYRLSNKESFFAAGFDEYLEYPDALVCIEWPEIIISELKEQCCFVRLAYYDQCSRKISWGCV